MSKSKVIQALSLREHHVGCVIQFDYTKDLENIKPTPRKGEVVKVVNTDWETSDNRSKAYVMIDQGEAFQPPHRRYLNANIYKIRKSTDGNITVN